MCYVVLFFFFIQVSANLIEQGQSAVGPRGPEEQLPSLRSGTPSWRQRRESWAWRGEQSAGRQRGFEDAGRLPTLEPQG